MWKDGTSKQPKNIVKLDKFPSQYTKNGNVTLKTQRSIRKLTGLTNMHRIFIPNYQAIISLLNELLTHGKEFEFTDRHRTAVEELRKE